jgi:hypothetical protein
MKHGARLSASIALALVSFDALAEISDKVPPVPALWGLAIVLCVLALLCGLLRPWAALIPGLFALTGIWSTLSDTQEAEYMRALHDELGGSYIWHQFGAWTVSFLVSVFVFVVLHRRKRGHSPLNAEVRGQVTIRDYLARRKRLFIGLAVVSWLGAAGSMFLAANGNVPWLFFVFFVGFAVAILGIMFFLRCPRCGGPIGATNATLVTDQMLFVRRINFCPYCGISLDEPYAGNT